jgi:hypothetical protein
MNAKAGKNLFLSIKLPKIFAKMQNNISVFTMIFFFLENIKEKQEK